MVKYAIVVIVLVLLFLFLLSLSLRIYLAIVGSGSLGPTWRDFEKHEIYKLDNGIEVCAMKDADVYDTYIYVHVDAGSIYDPPDALGLAHLFEHVSCHSSSKYHRGNDLISYSLEKLADGEYATTKEGIHYVSLVKNDHLNSYVDVLTWAIHDPIFNIQKIENEVKTITQEYNGYFKKMDYKIAMFINYMIDESFPEHQFSCGNAETLSSKDILDKIKDFHSKHITADRIKIFICSNRSINEQKQTLNSFNIIRRGDETSYSLTSKQIEMKFSEKFAGKIINFFDFRKDSKMYLNIMIYPIMDLSKFRLSEYFYEIVEDFENELKEKNIYTSIEVKNVKNRRNTVFTVEFDLSNVGYNSINSILDSFYTFIHSQQPNQYAFETIKKGLIESFRDKTTIQRLTYYCSEFIHSSSNKDLTNSLTSCEYNEEAIQNMLDAIGDIKKWAVLVSTEDQDLPNLEKYHGIKYSDPVPIQLSVDYSVEKEKKLTRQKEALLRYEERAKSTKSENLSTTKQYEIQPKPKFYLFYKLIHKKFDQGEYTFVEEKEVYRKSCMVKLTFLSKMTPQKSVDNLLFLSSFIQSLEYKNINLNFKLELKMEYFTAYPGLKLESSADKIVENIEFLMKALQEYKDKPAITKQFQTKFKAIAKNELENPGDLRGILLFEFMNLIHYSPQLYDIYELLNNTTECKFNEDYYIKIEALGDMEEYKVKQIFDILKSKNLKEKYQAIDVAGTKHKIKTFDSNKNGVLVGYSLGNILKRKDISIYKKYALAILLKPALETGVFGFFRDECTITYTPFMDTLFHFGNIYIVFVIDSTYSIDKITQTILKFKETSNIKKILERFDEKKFKQLTKNACDSDYLHFNRVMGLRLCSDIYSSGGFNSLNDRREIQKEITSMTKKEVFDLICQTFESEPVILTTDVVKP